LNLGDIDTHGDIDYLSLKNIDVKDKLKTFEKFILKDGDIVMSAKSTTLKTALIDLKSLKEQIIATGNLLIIRPNKEKINPVCLKVFFDSSIAKKQIELIETGSVMISINLNELGKIRIEIPTKKDQENIAKEYVIKKNIINTTRRNLMKLERDLKEISEKYFQEVK
jgi:restriction endonuclease S subunit